MISNNTTPEGEIFEPCTNDHCGACVGKLGDRICSHSCHDIKVMLVGTWIDKIPPELKREWMDYIAFIGHLSGVMLEQSYFSEWFGTSFYFISTTNVRANERVKDGVERAATSEQVNTDWAWNHDPNSILRVVVRQHAEVSWQHADFRKRLLAVINE